MALYRTAQSRVETEVGVALVIPALDIPGKFVDAGDSQIHASLMQTGAAAVLVAED